MLQTGLIEYLSGLISERRNLKMDYVLANRTQSITVVLEDIFQPQNASAVIRSCDCFGIQELHVIENRNKYRINPDVTLGSSKWVDVLRYNDVGDNTLACISALKNRGYTILATMPHKGGITLAECETNTKYALFFGNEADGLSQTVVQNADAYLSIPMCGFTESLNLSATAAICLYQMTTRLKSLNTNWQLSEEEKSEIKLRWLRKSLQRSELIEADYFNKMNTP